MATGATCTIMTHFAVLEDPRVERAKRHSLLDIVTIAVCAVICGADSWVEVEAFGQAKQAWCATFLALPNGIPAHDTFGRVFAALDGDQFAACFRGWVAAIAERTAGQVVAVDGKALRRSHDRGVGRGAGKGALHRVSAWACTNRLVLAQLPVTEKSNEITALPALLRMRALEGCIVTIDALGCQTEVARTIRDEGGDYVLALKGTQGRVQGDVEALCTEALATPGGGLAHETHRAVDGGHGRSEIRQAWVIDDPATLRYLDPDGRWPDLHCVGMVQAERRVGTEVSRETRSYISSLAASARTLNNAVRSHGGIENKVHWVLDLAFREDQSCARTGESARNMAVLRHRALNLLRRESTARCGIKARRLKAGWDHQYLLNVLAA